jgi:hypothetical protein
VDQRKAAEVDQSPTGANKLEKTPDETGLSSP